VSAFTEIFKGNSLADGRYAEDLKTCRPDATKKGAQYE
jgi:hypothetical protein